MDNYEGIVVHFGELWLKGRNRGVFVKKLYSNVGQALEGEKYSSIQNLRDRFLVVLGKKSNIKSIESKLSKTFGISWIAPVISCDNTLDAIFKSANKLVGKKETVRIVPHRSAKNTKFNSSDIVTHFIKNEKKLRFGIDKDSSTELFINVTKGKTFLYKDKIQSQKGLPVGTSGKAVVLLSGGIDSPVASYYAMKRGLEPIYMHVHAFPNNNDTKLKKIKRLAEVLSDYSGPSKVYYLPGHIFQSAALKVQPRYELVLFKLFLYRIAENIASKEGAECIVSGESLGQVASQTLSNLRSSEQEIDKFIMRPLIGFDKQEIIDAAKRIGTFDLSIEKYKDVCSIAAKDPATSSNYRKLKRMWDAASLDHALELTMKKSKAIKIS